MFFPIYYKELSPYTAFNGLGICNPIMLFIFIFDFHIIKVPVAHESVDPRSPRMRLLMVKLEAYWKLLHPLGDFGKLLS